MRNSFFALLVVIVILVPIQQASAQSPEMPLPALVLVDADGKPMAQVVGVELENVDGALGSGTRTTVKVAFDFGGSSELFSVQVNGSMAFKNNSFLWFTSDDCTGDPHMLESEYGEPTYLILGPYDDPRRFNPLDGGKDLLECFSGCGCRTRALCREN